MLFQLLDDKINCVGVYADGRITYDDLPDDLTQTWRYSPILKNKDVEYARLRCGGATLNSVCPPNLKGEWDRVSSKMKAFVKAFQTAKINLHDNCFYDLVPESFLLDFCEVKNSITEHVLKTYPKPPDYDFMVELDKMLTEVNLQKLNLDKTALMPRMHEDKVRKFAKSNLSPYILYDVFGSKTGRLTSLKGSFPIFNMNKEYRSIIKPHNDFFLELDFNAAELRMMLALLGKSQPCEDLHQWNCVNVFDNKKTREEAKVALFAWLYNQAAVDHRIDSVYDRKGLVERFWDGSQVHTIYDKIIPSDRWHALNYILQSTTAGMVQRQALKLFSFLEDKKSFLSYTIHDNVVIDMCEEDEKHMEEMIEIFSTTEFGKMLINVSLGVNGGELISA